MYETCVYLTRSTKGRGSDVPSRCEGEVEAVQNDFRDSSSSCCHGWAVAHMHANPNLSTALSFQVAITHLYASSVAKTTLRQPWAAGCQISEAESEKSIF